MMGGIRDFACVWFGASLMAACSGVVSNAATPLCSVAQAHYVSMADQKWTAGFKLVGKRPGWLSDVVFFVRSAKSKHTYQFDFDAGTARYVNLISTSNLGEMHYLSADEQLQFSLDIPKRKTLAPTYILLPDLQEVMWYQTPPMERESAPLAFFKLRSCD